MTRGCVSVAGAAHDKLPHARGKIPAHRAGAVRCAGRAVRLQEQRSEQRVAGREQQRLDAA